MLKKKIFLIMLVLGIILSTMALSGCTETRQVDCYSCEGSGNCPECAGLGIIDGEPCNACDGTGKCSRCNGEGVIEEGQVE